MILISHWFHPLQVIKLHMAAMHADSAIMLFGALVNTRCGFLEAVHRIPKRFYRKGSKATMRAGSQIAAFMTRHTAYLTVCGYQTLLAKQNLPTAETLAAPVTMRRKRKQPQSEEPRCTKPRGSFYRGKGDPIRSLVISRAERATDEHADDDDHLDISLNSLHQRDDAGETSLFIAGVDVAQVLPCPLPRFLLLNNPSILGDPWRPSSSNHGAGPKKYYTNVRTTSQD